MEGTPEEMGERIIKSITCNRIRFKKPSIPLIVGESGEGKSHTGLKILKIVNDKYEVDTLENLDNQVIFTPLEYANKLDHILYGKGEAKKLRAVMLDEARNLVKGKLWFTFVNQAIADVNAMHRGIKPLVFIVVTQSLKDIDSDTRATLQYYLDCVRPMNPNNPHVRLTPWRLWKDTYDLNNIKIRKRHVRGVVRKIGGGGYDFTVRNLIVSKPPKEIASVYDKIAFERKSKIVRNKLESLLKRIEKEIGIGFDRIDKLVEYYIEHQEFINEQKLIYRKGNKYYIDAKFKDMNDLTNTEAQEFKNRYIEKLTELRGDKNEENGLSENEELE